MKKQNFYLAILLLLIVGLVFLVFLRIYERPQPSKFARPPVNFPLVEKWQASLDGSGYGTPIYQNEQVFFATNKTPFASLWYGIEANSGSIIWSGQVRGWNSSLDCLNPNLLLIYGFQGFHALDPKTGNFIWQQQNNRWSTVCTDNEIITLVPRGLIEAYDISTGKLLWRDTKPSNRNFQSNLIYYERENKILGVAEDILYLILPETGEITSTFENKLPFGLTDSSLIKDSRLYSEDVVMNLNSGELVYLEHGSGWSPTISDNTVYLSAFSDGIIALEKETLQEKWIYKPFSPIQEQGASPVTLSEMAILGNVGYSIFSDATLRAIDLDTGSEIGYWQPGGEILANWPLDCANNPITGPSDCTVDSLAGLTVADDMLIVSFGGNKLYGLGRPN